MGFGSTPAAVNSPPVVLLEPDRALTVEPGEIVTLSAQGSYDREDLTTSQTWQQLSGPALAQAQF